MSDGRSRVLAVLNDGGPSIVYQPIVNLWTDTTVGYEALARFHDATPDTYFQTAHRVGLGHRLELAAIKNAVCIFRGSNLPGYLSINVSPGTLRAHPIDGEMSLPGGAQIEITESEPVAHYRQLSQALSVARRAGITLAIDDVGSGYAAMQHIINLLPDVLKLDRELVSGLHHVGETVRRSILAAYTHIAARNHFELIAEGIETAEEVFALRSLGINYGQGFHICRPLPIADLQKRQRQ
jgi:EAL domain-containing protein (putative c-di-GMP-specific phosphodiesterase class I)